MRERAGIGQWIYKKPNVHSTLKRLSKRWRNRRRIMLDSRRCKWKRSPYDPQNESPHQNKSYRNKTVADLCPPLQADTGGLHQKDLLEANVHVEILNLLKTQFQGKESPFAFRALACLGWMNEKGQADLNSLGFSNVLVKCIRTFSESATFITEASYALCGVFDGNKEETKNIG